jgi:hypothetical protein
MAVVRLLRSVAALLMLLVLAPEVRAQSLDPILASGIDRSTSMHEEEATRLDINYNDCRDNDVMTFDIGVRDNNDYNLEVWASTSAQCDVNENRRDNTKGCWFVYTSLPTNVKVSVPIAVRDIIAQSTNVTEVETAPAGVCETKELNNEVTLWFMLTSSGDIQGDAQTFKMTVDTVGPIAPTDVVANAGEEALFLGWSAQEASADRAGYDIYCVALDDGTATASIQQAQATDAGMDAGTSGAASGGSAGTAGSGGTSGAAGSGGTSGTGGSAGAAGESTTTNGDAGVSDNGLATDPNCPAVTGLVGGEKPPAGMVPCGHAASLDTGGTATGLQNGVSYAVAVATVDKLENHGKLSNVVCKVPVVVEDFFEIYRAAGGKGGGGFCGLSLNRGTSLGALAMVGLLLGLIVVRRRER